MLIKFHSELVSEFPFSNIKIYAMISGNENYIVFTMKLFGGRYVI